VLLAVRWAWRAAYSGTWIASYIIGLGILIYWSGVFSLGEAGTRLITSGVALFITLPVLRVALMAIVFVQDREYVYGLIATTVLLIIAIGAAVGIWGSTIVH
jgi:uncharacterized membrane protein